MNAGSKETSIFAFVGYVSRTHRNEVNAVVMAEIGDEDETEMPSDVAARMASGGFETIVDDMAEPSGESIEMA